ncbi:MAG: hypothetical protein WBB28_06120 [Crinalium sp.]
MNKIFLWFLRSPCLLIFGIFSGCFLYSSTVQAGGFDQQKPPPEQAPSPPPVPDIPPPISPSSTPVVPPSPPPATTNKTSPLNLDLSIINWDKWGQTYWLNQNICREMNGNVICLSAQTARRMYWQIPAKSQALNSATNSPVRARKL